MAYAMDAVEKRKEQQEKLRQAMERRLSFGSSRKSNDGSQDLIKKRKNENYDGGVK